MRAGGTLCDLHRFDRALPSVALAVDFVAVSDSLPTELDRRCWWPCTHWPTFSITYSVPRRTFPPLRRLAQS